MSSIPEKHQVKIAKATLKMSDVGAMIMGGMTKDEAKEILVKQQKGKGSQLHTGSWEPDLQRNI